MKAWQSGDNIAEDVCDLNVLVGISRFILSCQIKSRMFWSTTDEMWTRTCFWCISWGAVVLPGKWEYPKSSLFIWIEENGPFKKVNIMKLFFLKHDWDKSLARVFWLGPVNISENSFAISIFLWWGMRSVRRGEGCTSLPNISKKTSSRTFASRQMSCYRKCRCEELPARLWLAGALNVIGCSMNGGGQEGPECCVINLFTCRTRNCWQPPVSNVHQSAYTHKKTNNNKRRLAGIWWRNTLLLTVPNKEPLTIAVREPNSQPPASSKRVDENSRHNAKVWASDRQNRLGRVCWSINAESINVTISSI